MFETWSHLALQQYWWVIIALLGGLFVFMMFVQGGQTLLWSLSKNELEKSMLVNSLGRKWELGFTTLVLFGGALFAAFPLFYAASFGGAYWVWMAILFCFILQAVAYEYRKKPDNLLGAKTFEVFLFINGSLGVILVGTAVATFFSGSEFYVNEANLSAWKHPLRGLEAAFDPFNLFLGIAVFFLARILGAMYFINNVDHTGLGERSRKAVAMNTLFFLPFFLLFVGLLLFKEGFAVDPATKTVAMESGKYLANFLAMPICGLGLFLAGVVLVLAGVFVTVFRGSKRGIWFSGTGTVLTVMALFFAAGFNHTAYYPSTFDLQSSLTIENSSGSHYTLTAMSYVSLMVPFVLAYIAWVWRAMDREKITAGEIEADSHAY